MLQVTAAIAVVAIVVVLAMVGLSPSFRTNSYEQAVLALQGNAVQGHAIFQMNCAGCHGSMANGRVGPSLLKVSERRSKLELIRQVTSGKTPPMPQFQPTPQEMADLLEYLEHL